MDHYSFPANALLISWGRLVIVASGTGVIALALMVAVFLVLSKYLGIL